MFEYFKTTAKQRKLERERQIADNVNNKIMPASSRPSRLRKNSGKPVHQIRGKIVNYDENHVPGLGTVILGEWNPTQRPKHVVRAERRRKNKRARMSRKANR